MEKKSIIIFGPPRSGTTWLASVLSLNDLFYVHEPDNGKNNFLALVLQNNMHRFPYLKIDNKNDLYLKLFELALNANFLSSSSRGNTLLFRTFGISRIKIEENLSNNGKYLIKDPILKYRSWKMIPKDIPATRQPRLIKTVHAVLSIPFLKQHLNFIPLLIFRHPCAIISSMASMNLMDINRNLQKEPRIVRDYLSPHMEKIGNLKHDFEFYGLQAGIFHHVMSDYIKKYNYPFVIHENLCERPMDEFKTVFSIMQLEWTKQTGDFIESQNKEGSGYEIARDLKTVNNAWKKKLTGEQIQQIKTGYSIFPNQIYQDFSTK